MRKTDNSDIEKLLKNMLQLRESSESIHNFKTNNSDNGTIREQTELAAETPTETDKGKNKKLVSRRCAKPDECDIKMQVKYPHEKLDPRHVIETNRNFDQLPLYLLIVGELELVEQEDISKEERNVRIAIAKTLCYHKMYLEDEDLRNGYDQIVKKVERGMQGWDRVFGEHLHEYLNYRVNVNLREQIQEGNTAPFTKVDRKKNRQDENNKMSLENKERVIYCQDYNNQRCRFKDHHKGKFAGKTVTKFHICKKCHQSGEIRSHRETDDFCPRKEA